MKKLVPFRKEIVFETNIFEVTSISLENTLTKEGNLIKGNFTVSGEYLVTDSSETVLPFTYDIPCDIDIDDNYDISNATVDVDDFYYEILNDNIMVVNIEVRIDHIKEKPLEREYNMEDKNEECNDVIIVDEHKEEYNINEDSTLFNNLDGDNYVNYRVYIVRDGDTVESIISKYNITIDMLKDYNDITNIKTGDKIIIPYVKN